MQQLTIHGNVRVSTVGYFDFEQGHLLKTANIWEILVTNSYHNTIYHVVMKFDLKNGLY